VRELIDGCPAEFGKLLQHIDDMKFYHRPDYRWIMKTLRDYLNTNRIQEHPYDWELRGGARPAAGPAHRGGGGGGGKGAVDSYFK
jgi:hypothetical protein